MTMKRFLAIALAITLLIATGCGSHSGNTENPDSTQNNNTQTTETPETPAPDETGSDSATTETEEPAPDYGDSDYNPTVTGSNLGDTIADFTVNTYDGKSVTLSDVLREKDAVLINIFATWCGPCKSEFPFMEEAYKQFQDRVEVIALSGDGSDTSAMIRDLATSLKLTFPVGQDTVGICRAFKINAFPTSILIDRFGTIVFIHVGSLPDAESFASMYEFLLSDEYTESVVLDEIPPAMPHLDQLSSDELSQALDAGELVFENAPGQYNWPMTTAEVDGKTVLVSTNYNKGNSRSAVQTTVTATAGDVFAFDMKLSSEETFDFFTMSVNGEVVKVFTGEEDWLTYGYAFPADGEYLVELAYEKDHYTDSEGDALWLDNARLLSGDDAAAALAATPSYPTAEETSFYISNKNVTRVFFEDPYSIVYKIFGCPYEAYIIDGLEANCVFTLAGNVDPEAALCYDNHDLRYTLPSIVSGKNYAVTFTIDSMETTGKGYTYVTLDPNILADGEKYPILFFANVEGLEKFVKTFAAGAWCTEDELESAPWYQPEEEPVGDVAYTFRCVDENGEAISGVTLQVCNDSTCSVYVSDENGECVLTLPADQYEIHVLKAPEGFAFDSAAVIEAPVEGGEIVISLTRA